MYPLVNRLKILFPVLMSNVISKLIISELLPSKKRKELTNQTIMSGDFTDLEHQMIVIKKQLHLFAILARINLLYLRTKLY